MRIFLSHSSVQKPLVREVKSHLPHHLTQWIDEEQLLFGDAMSMSIEVAIKSESDYVLLFLDGHAAASAWVRKELRWALEAEQRHHRTIVLPIVLEAGSMERLGNPHLLQRKYLVLKDYQATSVRVLAQAIAADLFALVCRDMHRLEQPQAQGALGALADAEELLRQQAHLIQRAVFPHRGRNPIQRDKLLDVINTHTEHKMTDEEFQVILDGIVKRNMIPGLHYDGSEAFVIEEHASWKADVQRQDKERVGRKAITLIPNGCRVFLDAGSTSEEIVRLLCKRIETRAVTKVTVATTSVNIADMISDCCVTMGFDDDFSAVRLYVPGGRIRPSTQAIVPLSAAAAAKQIQDIGEEVGGFDVGIVGVNGIDIEGGFTTREEAEATNKAEIMAVSRDCIIAGDSSKLGLILECKFADFQDNVRLVIDENSDCALLPPLLDAWGSKVLLA